MRKLILVPGLLLVASTVVGCGGNGATSARPSPHASTSAPTTNWSGKLLTAADVGPGWQTGQPLNSADLAAFAQLPCERSTLSPAVAKRLSAATGVQFEPTDRSYKHVIELVVTGESARLADDLASLFAAVESCSTSGSGVDVERLPTPQLGDQRAAYAIHQPGPSGSTTTIYVRTGYVRLGSSAVALGLADFGATTTGKSQITDETYLALLNAAVAKLGG